MYFKMSTKSNYKEHNLIQSLSSNYETAKYMTFLAKRI